MAYIIAVNVCCDLYTLYVMLISQANILSQSGGTCVCPGTNPNDPACNVDTAYNQCLIGMMSHAKSIQSLISLAISRDLITATAAIAGISSISFGFLTNLPVALA